MQHHHTGELCNSAAEYGTAVQRLENRELNHRFGENARVWIKNAVGTWDDCAERYHSIYGDLRAESAT